MNILASPLFIDHLAHRRVLQPYIRTNFGERMAMPQVRLANASIARDAGVGLRAFEQRT